MFITRLIAWLLWGTVIVPYLTAGATPPKASSRDYLVHVWQTDDGLPQNWVSSIAQTPDSYLWVGTRYGGLARFDGVRFVPFNPQNTPALKDIQVEHLSVDDAGRLWVVMGNESITSAEGEEFTLQRWPRAQPRLRAGQVLLTRSNQVVFAGENTYLVTQDQTRGTNGWALHDARPSFEVDTRALVTDHAKTIWFATPNLRLARFVDGRLSLANQLPGLIEPRTTALAVDAAQQLWITSPRRVLSWNGESFVDRTPTNGPAPREILQLAFSGDGGLWVLERNRLRKILNGEWAVTADETPLLPDAPARTVQLYGDAQGGAWIVHYGHGLAHVRADGRLYRFSEGDGLPSVLINTWFQDNEGDVWVGTSGGLARIRATGFTALTKAQGLLGKSVRSVSTDPSGQLWVGLASGGLAQWRTGAFAGIPLPLPTTPSVDSVTVIPDHAGHLWIGTVNHGLLRMTGDQVERITTPGGFGSAIRTLFVDRKNQLWIGGLVNLFRYDGEQFQQFGRGEGFEDGHAIGDMAEDATGTLWIGTGPGDLWKFSEGRFTRFTPPPAWPSVRISAVRPDTNGVVWVGTLGGGLLRFEAGQFTRYTLDDGLPDNNISQLLDSGDGHLWAGTYAGIFRVQKSELSRFAAGASTRIACRVYGRFDGLPALECSSGFQPACWRTPVGRLWFSTANGVVSVHPTEAIANRKPPVVRVEELWVDGKRRSLSAPARSSASSASTLTIEPGRHYLEFRFTGMNFIAPDGVRFRAKLDPVKSEWQDLAGQRAIGYGPLLPGQYQFRVSACNNDGIWNETGATLAFVVLPYFWETWWFRTILILVTLAVLGSIVALVQRQRYHRRLERVERQREMEQERARIARDLHDDLGTSLTQISLLSALANREQTPAPEAKELIQEVRGRAREMVIALDEIVWAVNPQNDSLAGLVGYLGHFAEEFFRASDIRFRLDLPASVPVVSLSAESRHHLFLAFKEAVNNVARHSSATEVQVRVVITAQEISISVTDNGHGFAGGTSSEAPPGDGLANMKRRLEQLGGRTEVQSQPGGGTTVTFHAPLQGH